MRDMRRPDGGHASALAPIMPASLPTPVGHESHAMRVYRSAASVC